MGDTISAEEIRDMTEVKRLRNYYRKNFQNGDSDECFLTWVETTLEKMGYQVKGNHG